MDVNWLRDLVEVNLQGSFSKAARARNISVSSLSRRIQLLEAWSSQVLVDRSSHPVRLTLRGEQLLPVAQAVVREIDRVRDRLRQSGGSVEPVRFLAPNSVSVAVFPRLLALLQNELGALPVNLIPENFREVHRRFRNGDAEFALYYVAGSLPERSPMDHYQSVPLAHDLLLPVARDAAAAQGRKRGAVRGVLLDEASYLGQVARAAILASGLEYEVSVTGSQILAIRQLAIEGAGQAWLPASLVAEDIAAKRLQRVLPRLKPVPFTVHVARQPESLHPMHQQVWQLLSERAAAGAILHFDKPFA